MEKPQGNSHPFTGTLDGSSNEADETTVKIQRAKAQLAATLHRNEQIKQIRKHLNLVEDDTQSSTTTSKKRLRRH